MERQQHGFSFEQEMIRKYGIIKSKEYTSKWDGKLNGFPVSIKIAKYGTDIEMADIFRQMEVEEDFYLIVGFWQDNKMNIVERYMLKINGKEYHSLFNLDFKQRLQSLLCEITNSHEDDEKWRLQITQLRKDWKNGTPNLIRLRFKRDHKSQKRIQCAINNKDFYNYFIKRYEV